MNYYIEVQDIFELYFSVKDKILPASMAPHVNLTMSSNLYGLAERVVATESL